MSTLADLYKRPSKPILPAHISHMVADGNYTVVHFVDGSKVLFSTTMKQFVEWHPLLIRINKQLLFNLANLTDWELIDKKTMWVEVSGIRYWVSRRRVDRVVEQITEAPATNQ